MALPKDFPKSPYQVLDPDIRWFPEKEELPDLEYAKLLPPLVDKLRREVAQWRSDNYEGVSQTSRALLRWWFQMEHPIETSEEMINFQYYFAQREAIETVVYLYEKAEVRNKNDLIRYDSSGGVSLGMFPEEWLRFVIKMATGSGKTKVMSLIIAWSYFHKLYEENSMLSRNFLLITPNIIVLDRLETDFGGLRIFDTDPILPDNGYEGQNWKDDFQTRVHRQDDVNAIRPTGNIFLTNIHRVYSTEDSVPTIDDENTTDYFLGDRAVAKTGDSKVDLGEIARDMDELMVLNDEAHHIHKERLAWFKTIEDISNRMKMKGKFLSLQLDFTATPKQESGAIFVQTISDYPLVEAIHQNVVKRPIVPDVTSRAKLEEHKSLRFTERYKDYIELGFLEWKRAYDKHKKMNKKSILFLMTNDTKNCDELSEYLENTYPELKGAVLIIHTKNNGEISENVTGKKEKELKELRDAANKIDSRKSPYKAIVSVLMLKEGWDVRNVTTIVGLRPYVAKSNILPEQTLGRGLRRMYADPALDETVSVVGTDAFMDFVEKIKSEGVELEERRMGKGAESLGPLVIEIDKENLKKDIKKLDIRIPVLTSRLYREYRNLKELNPADFKCKKLSLIEFNAAKEKEINLQDIISEERDHTTLLKSNFVASHQSVIGYLATKVRNELRLVRGHDVLYEKIKEFIINFLFDKKVDLEDLNTRRNLRRIEVERAVTETFKKEINDLTVLDKERVEIQKYLEVSKVRPFLVKEQEYVVPRKSVFNKIIGDSYFELQFAGFLEDCDDIISYAKNYFAVHFTVDYQNTDGDIRSYYPDFFVKVSEKEIYIVETKGQEDLDDIKKIERLYQWCKDANAIQQEVKWTALYVKQEDYQKYTPSNFSEIN